MAIQNAGPGFLALALLSFSLQGAAQVPALQRPAPLGTRITIDVKAAPLGRLLDTISAQNKINFIMTEEGIADRRMSVSLKNATVAEALHQLIELKGLSYHQVGASDTYLITRKTKPGQEAARFRVTEDSPALETKVTVRVKHAPLKGLLEQFSAMSKIHFTIAKGLESKKVTADLQNMTIRDALQILVEIKGIGIRQTGKNDFAVDSVPPTPRP